MADVRNPSPPPEIDESDLPSDTVGDSMYSKHWILSTLTNILEILEDDENEDCNSLEVKELDTTLETKLCCIWDMSVDSNVAQFLMEFNSPKIFMNIIRKSCTPRLNEILIGIIANISTNEEYAESLAKDVDMRNYFIQLMQCGDALVILQIVRLLDNMVQFEKSRKFIADEVMQNNEIYENLLFILESSVNGDLIQLSAKLILQIMDCSDAIHIKWVKESDLVKAVLEAFKELRKNKFIIGCQYLCHILYYVSCINGSITHIGNHQEDIIFNLVSFLTSISKMSEIPKEIFNNAAGAASLINTLLLTDGENIHILDLEKNDLACVIVKILHNYLQEVPTTKTEPISEDTIISAMTELLSNLILHVKTSENENLRHVLLSQLETIFKQKTYRNSLREVWQLHSQKVESKFLKKMLEDHSKEDFISLQNELSENSPKNTLSTESEQDR